MSFMTQRVDQLLARALQPEGSRRLPMNSASASANAQDRKEGCQRRRRPVDRNESSMRVKSASHKLERSKAN
jgi:hypothetical protein